MPELAEFCDRRSYQSGLHGDGDQLMLGNINVALLEACEKFFEISLHKTKAARIIVYISFSLHFSIKEHSQDIPEDRRYFLIHKGGYTTVQLIKHFSDGRALVKVADREMTVDSTDIDRMNPSTLDRVGDIAALRYLNETSALHLLRQRFHSNLLHTNAGLLSVVCLTSFEESIVGQDRIVSLFKGCRRGQMPPHICATAQVIYRNLQMTGQDQCIVLTGISGSGKTSQLRNLVHYFAEVAGWTHTLPCEYLIFYQKLSLAMGVMEAFGHAASIFHRDSTRFLYLFSLGFDKAAALRAGRFYVSLLEIDRVGKIYSAEGSFHVFYYLWEGADGMLRDRLWLDSIEQPPVLPHSTKKDKKSVKEVSKFLVIPVFFSTCLIKAWNRLQHAFMELGFNENHLEAINSVLAAILHIQVAGCTPGNAQRARFLRISHAEHASVLLGVSVEDLTNAVFHGKMSENRFTSKIDAASRMVLTSRSCDSQQALQSFCAGLYEVLFYSLVESVNKAMFSNQASCWISILDYPGSSFHINWINGSGQKALGLNDLVYNYVNERVAEFFYNRCFVDTQELACTDIDRRSEEKRGLFAILEEESLFPGATDESLF
ncbi:myosin head [Dictyocaulus viviparus]|uniref:Myosin head n=1 Tax=Dictyocaulus viviparus TaxID=29172 RepID=A0A0D8XNQ9_DICVI|nr:myosin head [Dictyocaulus viviparus]